MQRAWTNKEEDLVLALRRDGLKVREIAERVHRSVASVELKLVKMKRGQRAVPPTRTKQAVQLAAWENLRRQIALAKAERATAPLYRGGPVE